MNVLNTLNGLHGRVVTRKELEALVERAKEENNAGVIYRVSKILNAYPDIKSFEIDVEQYPTPSGLGAVWHTGDYKEALDECGRLRKGWKFSNGGVVFVGSDKKKSKKTTQKTTKKTTTKAKATKTKTASKAKKTSESKPVYDVENITEQKEKVAERPKVNISDLIYMDLTDKHLHLTDKGKQEKQAGNLEKIVHQLSTEHISGGVSKKGRGVLDEYYTPEKIAESVMRIVSHYFDKTTPIRVLEPSVGTGVFLKALHDSNLNAVTINAYEVDQCSAGIAYLRQESLDMGLGKTNVYLKPFETVFVQEELNTATRKPAGTKLNYSPQYDLVIGNPPYGAHRGKFIALKEEPNIKQYEDYFVKRSLDLLLPGGILAMVLPHRWIENQKDNDYNYTLVQAYRLPNGVFKATQVGTDIIILRKNVNGVTVKADYSTYFKTHKAFILGEEKPGTDQFGKPVTLVKGKLSDALEQLNTLIENIQHTTVDVVEVETPKIEQVEPKQKKTTSKTESKPSASKDRKKKDENGRLIQTKPEIIQGVLSYRFKKDDEIVDTLGQVKNQFTDKQLRIFKALNYDGTPIFEGAVPKEELYYDPELKKHIHKFFFAQGDIYRKLGILQNTKNWLEKVKDLNSLSEAQKQELVDINRSIALLNQYKPKEKSISEFSISPNHKMFDEIRIFNGVQTVVDNFDSYLDELKDEKVIDWDERSKIRNYINNYSPITSKKKEDAQERKKELEQRKALAEKYFEKYLVQLPPEQKNIIEVNLNRRLNNLYVPDYSKYPLFSKIYKNFNGKPLQLTNVQLSGVGRLTAKGIGLLAHEVGFGKTLSGIVAMHEAMTRGYAKRPLIVVPNDNILKQWFNTIFEIIPDAKVNVLGNLGVKYDVDGSKFKVSDGDITLVTYNGFKNITFEEEVVKKYTKKYHHNVNVSDKNAKKLSLENLIFGERHNPIQQTTEREEYLKTLKSEAKLYRTRESALYLWSEFDFDHLTFDEVHNANHIVESVKKLDEDGNFSSFNEQNQTASKLGLCTWLACCYIQDKHNGRNVTLLSATPFTNKPLEYYSILSLISLKRLEELGYSNVNYFFSTFMDVSYHIEFNAKRETVLKSTIKSFKNNTLFRMLLSEFIDFKGEDDNPDLKRPNRLNKEYYIDANQEYKNISNCLEGALREANHDDGGALLSFITHMRMASVSPFLVNACATNAPKNNKEFIERSPKLNMMMQLIRKNKQKQPDACQIIYSEVGKDIFEEIEKYLIEQVGYKKNEVAIIKSGVSLDKRIAIQDKFNAGDIKIIIGSSAISEGMNLQKRTSDIYILSLPYNFTDLRQVEGRLWRQGNVWENVRVNYMLQNDSNDVFMLQKLQDKQSRYNQAIKGEVNVLDVSDISTEEIKLSLIRDPELRAKLAIKDYEDTIRLKKQSIDKEYVNLNAISSDNFFELKQAISIIEERMANGEKQNDIKLEIYEFGTYKLSMGNIRYLSNYIRNKNAETYSDIKNIRENLRKQGSELSEKLKDENLNIKKAEYIAHFTKLNEEQDAKRVSFDYIKERAKENETFYRTAVGMGAVYSLPLETRYKNLIGVSVSRLYLEGLAYDAKVAGNNHMYNILTRILERHPYQKLFELTEQDLQGEALGLGLPTATDPDTIAFNKEILKIKRSKNKVKDGHIINLGKAKGVLKSIIGEKDLTITNGVIYKSMNKDGDHIATWEHFINLPDALNHPIAVFKSKTKEGGKIVLTELKTYKEKPLMAALHINNGAIVKIASIYSKRSVNIYKKWIQEGLCEYHKEKMALDALTTQSNSGKADHQEPVQMYDKKINKQEKNENFLGLGAVELKNIEVGKKNRMNSTQAPVAFLKDEESSSHMDKATTKNEITKTKTKKVVKNDLPIIPITQTLSVDDMQFFNLRGDVGAFLQQVERKKEGSVLITIDGEFGAGKTTMLYHFMDAFASEGHKSVFFSLEEGANNYLIAQKRDKYLSGAAQNNLSVVDNIDDLETFYRCIEPFDIVFIDSWQKVLEIEGAKNIKIDKELRKKFNSKVFIIIFQQNKQKQTKGKSEVLFDGDIIIKMKKGENFSENYAYMTKNRYTLVPLDMLAYNIAQGSVFDPYEVEQEE